MGGVGGVGGVGGIGGIGGAGVCDVLNFPNAATQMPTPKRQVVAIIDNLFFIFCSS
jgi:hypothetical protein